MSVDTVYYLIYGECSCGILIIITQPLTTLHHTLELLMVCRCTNLARKLKYHKWLASMLDNNQRMDNGGCTQFTAPGRNALNQLRLFVFSSIRATTSLMVMSDPQRTAYASWRTIYNIAVGTNTQRMVRKYSNKMSTYHVSAFLCSHTT